MQLIEAIRAGRAAPPSGITTLGLDTTHHWIIGLTPGQVSLEWPADDAHLDLQGGIICSWVTAVADQALFFATNSACASGEATRTAELTLRSLRDIRPGPVAVVATVLHREGDRMFGECTFRPADGGLSAHVTATIDVLRADTQA